MNLQLHLVRLSAMVLLLLAASPYTAPFAVCDITDGPHSDHAATRHLTHASAVVRPAAQVTRQPIVLGAAVTRAAARLRRSDFERQQAAWQPPAPARHLVLRV